MSAATHVVILGGGIGGLETAAALGRKHDVSVTLIDRNPVHVWKPALHEFAAGTISHQANCFPFSRLASRFGFSFIQSSFSAIDRAGRRVTLEDGREVTYDYLVVALGSSSNDFGIPGVKEHCLFLEDLTQADALFARFRNAVAEARKTGERLSLGIVGGGATGVQLAAELCQSIDKAPGLGASTRRALLDAVLIETGPRILPAFPEDVSSAAAKELEALGIAVRTDCMVTGVDEKGFQLKSGDHLASSLKIWAAGVKAGQAMDLFEGIERGRAGQILVSPTLQSLSDPHILAIGDCSRIDSAPLAPTAQVARQQGIYAGRTALPALIDGHAPSPFVYTDRGSVVALADYNAWGMWPSKRGFGGKGLGAIFAHFIHEGLFRQHQAGLVGVSKMLCTALRERLSPLRPDLRSATAQAESTKS